MSLKRAELDRAGCSDPDCAHDHSVLYLRSRCHTNAPVEVRYEKQSAEIVVTCKFCKREVARIEVAP